MADPWLKFYTTDWRADPALRVCSLAARGLWIDLICVMHEATPYGHLLVNGRRPTDAQVAVLVGTSPAEFAALLGELETAGVFSRTKDGTIYSRKLTRMAKKAATARNNGRKGGNPSLRKDEDLRPSDNPQDKGGDKPQKPEARDQKKEKGEADASPKKKADKATRLPDDWRLPKEWSDWALSQGLDEVSVRREADKFRDHWHAKGGREAAKLDWLATWRNWARTALERTPTKRAANLPQIGDERVTTTGKTLRYGGPIDGWGEVRR